MIKLTNLTKTYRKHEAVKNINIKVNPGEIYGFLGPNGAGKTTTIKMVAGALAPTSGQILLNGIDLAKEPSKAKQITGYIPDRPFLYEKLTAIEFLEFFADLYNVKKEDFLKRSTNLLNLFELSNWRHELIENFSHGMKQRLIMASALLTKPRILIVDEPMVGLDPRGVKLVIDIFKFLAEKEKVAILISTHTMSLASRICHRIGIIFKGELIATGTEKELKNQTGSDQELENIFLKLTDGDNPQYLEGIL